MLYVKNERTGKHYEEPPYKCKMCGQYEIEFPHDICRVCGWEDDDTQQDNTNFVGGANQMSFNQYKIFWDLYKSEILEKIKYNKFYAIEKSQEYYEKVHKANNDEIIQRELNGEEIQELKISDKK